MTHPPPARGSIVVLTGAGISVDSGLDTFRDKDGIWAHYSIEEVATPEAFARDPDKVHAFYNARRRQLAAGDLAPNPAHEALVRLEREWPDEVLVVTQNVDDLHDRAGQGNLIHMHGELLKARCDACGDIERREDDLSTDTPCPACGRAGGLRPHVVWFGEMPFELERIFSALAACDAFISIGTSGNVYPAAGFVQEAKRAAGAHTVELNLDPSEGASHFDDRRHGGAADIVPAYVDELLAARGAG